ncbi:MAG: uL14 family ribosomal protein [Nanoarchaeota archaeon]
MKSIISKNSRGLETGAVIDACDNSGAKKIRIFTVYGHKTVKRRRARAGIADMVMASVVRGKPDIRKKVVYAVIVRQKKEFKRVNGLRVSFEDNAAVLLKDNKGNPKGTAIKGPIAKEVTIRWPAISKIASNAV